MKKVKFRFPEGICRSVENSVVNGIVPFEIELACLKWREIVTLFLRLAGYLFTLCVSILMLAAAIAKLHHSHHRPSQLQ